MKADAVARQVDDDAGTAEGAAHTSGSLPPSTQGQSSGAFIPLCRPHNTGEELGLIAEVLASSHIGGDRAFTKHCHALLEQSLGVNKVLLTTSCTHALEMCALLLGVGPGDEVIVPSYTFVSTANAFALRGAKPVFVDVRADTLNLDEGLVEERITERTKAIVPVHYAGVGCEMDALGEIAKRRGVAVVEDVAHGLFGKYKGRYLGTFGALAALSFHETKNFSCGEGGALLINDSSLFLRAEIIREKGTDRSRFYRGEIDKYTWQDIGSSYLPSDILAAHLYAQLKARSTIQGLRRGIFEFYERELGDWAAQNGVRLPTVPAHCEQAYHMFYLLLPTPEARTRLLDFLRQRGVSASFHYVPLHTCPMGQRFGNAVDDCPVTVSVSDRLARIPLFSGMAPEQMQRVVDTVRSFRV